MAQKKKTKLPLPSFSSIPDHTRQSIWSILLIIVGLFLALAAFGTAGPAGNDVYGLLAYLLGFGYFIVPLLFLILGASALSEDRPAFEPLKLIASVIFVVTGLGFVEAVSGHGGLLGHLIAGPVVQLFDIYAGSIILGGLLLTSLLIVLEGRISLETLKAVFRPLAWIGGFIVDGIRGAIESGRERREARRAARAAEADMGPDEEVVEHEEEVPAAALASSEDTGSEIEKEPVIRDSSKHAEDSAPTASSSKGRSTADILRSLLGEYNNPPLSLLERDRGKASVGDIKANANIIKRTLQNFGIIVELDEISVGPSVTRYAIKPAEGVRLSKIVALQQNLELALAAHPVRIEAPIPGKSLVGIEVPNSAKVTVGLGTMLAAPEFASSDKPLLVALGRDITGGSHFANLAKMPHLLIAGTTGSGKSVAIHTLITSLLYRNGPQTLRFIMIDPKRVELTLYKPLPHLLSPVITDPKRAIAALRWAGKEMQRRYDILESERVRDIGSYHSNVLKPALERIAKKGLAEGEEAPDALPYIVIVIDELADIMQTFPRELEAAIVRLAQMSRAVGIHLVLSTQRPSVNVITGLIKANVPSRVALQVASQIDSRTIIDQAGAEKLLGAGDMLYLSSDMGKPVRLQSAYIGEDEVKHVADYISKHNEVQLPIDLGMPTALSAEGGSGGSGESFSGDMGGGFDEDVDDDMYEAAKEAVIEAGKASTSYIQRKLRIGYSRAARIMDILEQRGVIGPQDGAKPREILLGKTTGADAGSEGAGEEDPE